MTDELCKKQKQEKQKNEYKQTPTPQKQFIQEHSAAISQVHMIIYFIENKKVNPQNLCDVFSMLNNTRSGSGECCYQIFFFFSN